MQCSFKSHFTFFYKKQKNKKCYSLQVRYDLENYIILSDLSWFSCTPLPDAMMWQISFGLQLFSCTLTIMPYKRDRKLMFMCHNVVNGE